jgi:hypothetical protein
MYKDSKRGLLLRWVKQFGKHIFFISFPNIIFRYMYSVTAELVCGCLKLQL